ncbi:hypothetical protein DASC09_035920 [Saccharomycopsis crataegensis]|uniref:Uncharacterized protein n=1 Tax=Saccharomycopsis crataegensis TaxID=43959 RepID=A0AAV5QN80_9ASCO|nr:hypothetical protein DASC09_035920 [Saccharomycopsis crataegensis]
MLRADSKLLEFGFGHITQLQDSQFDNLNGLLYVLSSLSALYISICSFFIEGSCGLCTFHNVPINDRNQKTFKELAEDLILLFGKMPDGLRVDQVKNIIPKCSPGVVLSFICTSPIFIEYIKKYLNKPAVQLYVLFDSDTYFWTTLFPEDDTTLFRNDRKFIINHESLKAYIWNLHKAYQSSGERSSYKTILYNTSLFKTSLYKTSSKPSVMSEFYSKMPESKNDFKDSDRLFKECNELSSLLYAGNYNLISGKTLKYIAELSQFAAQNIHVVNGNLERGYPLICDISEARRYRLISESISAHSRIKSYFTATNGDSFFQLKERSLSDVSETTLTVSEDMKKS